MKRKALAFILMTVVILLFSSWLVISQISEFQNQINELQTQNSDLQNQIGELQAQNVELQDQKSSLQEKLRELLGIPVKITAFD
jgi:FtsZ-binding cell division protein ZapB